MSPAEAAISKFIAEWRKMRGIHPNDVTSLHAGDDTREATLRISDMVALLSELDALRAATQLCEKHKPSGGTRSVCLVCAGEKLTAALSRIDYLCGPPNEMEVSGYDVLYEEQAVVANVQALRARCDKAESRVAQLGEPWVDENETAWLAPTAWAYAQVCRVKDDLRARCEAAEALLQELAQCECYDWEETLYDRIDAHLKGAGRE